MNHNRKTKARTLIFFQKRKIFFDKINLKQKEINLINIIFYNSNAIKINGHKMNHNFYNL